MTDPEPLRVVHRQLIDLLRLDKPQLRGFAGDRANLARRGSVDATRTLVGTCVTARVDAEHDKAAAP